MYIVIIIVIILILTGEIWRESCAAQDKVIAAESLDTTRTLVLSGRPLRLIPNDWIRSWEQDPMKVKEFCDKGMLGLSNP